MKLKVEVDRVIGFGILLDFVGYYSEDGRNHPLLFVAFLCWKFKLYL